jgi:hypothetical protein
MLQVARSKRQHAHCPADCRGQKASCARLGGESDEQHGAGLVVSSDTLHRPSCEMMGSGGASRRDNLVYVGRGAAGQRRGTTR